MAYDFRLPDLGEGIAEGEVIEWLVKEGDTVKEHQAIVKMETDKAVVEVPSPKAGKLLKINFKAGDVVKVGEILCSVGAEGETVKEEKLVAKPAPKEMSGFSASKKGGLLPILVLGLLILGLVRQ